MAYSHFWLTSLGISLALTLGGGIVSPLWAQIDEPPDVLEAPIPDGEVDVRPGDETIEPSTENDSAPTPDVPAAGSPAIDELILLTIDGESAYYAPVSVDEEELEGLEIPTYTLDEGQSTTPRSDSMVDDNEATVTFPPANDLEDLQPEDIVE